MALACDHDDVAFTRDLDRPGDRVAPVGLDVDVGLGAGHDLAERIDSAGARRACRRDNRDRRAGELLGFDPERELGIRLTELMAGRHDATPVQARSFATLTAVTQSPEREARGDLELQEPNRILHWVAQPTKNPGGTTTAFTLTFRDVTQEREVSRMKSDFVSFVTHQLRTPLSGIKWMLELAAQVQPDPLDRAIAPKPGELRPWHYHDPFFQEPPAVYESNLDAPYARADILKLCRDFYGGLGLLTMRVARNLTLPPSYFWLVAREIDIIGVRSLVVALTAALFTGMVLALQSSVQLKTFGATMYIGNLVSASMIRELGPVLTALMVGGRVGSGITAELGSMKVTEQIDAFRAIGVNYIKRLLPRSEQIEFERREVAVDNSWLYVLLDSYTAETDPQRRNGILSEVSGRLRALDW